MKPRIVNLAIEHFRAFRELNLAGLGRVNLITGRNNTGKSSLLEALRLLASNASSSVLAQILKCREEDAGGPEATSKETLDGGLFYPSSLFHGFPALSSALSTLLIKSEGGSEPMVFSMRVERFKEERAEPAAEVLVSERNGRFAGAETVLGILVDTGEEQAALRRDSRGPFYSFRSQFVDPRSAGGKSVLACEFVSAYGGERTATLGLLWDRIALSDDEEEVVKALHIIDPGIIAVDMIGGSGSNQPRTAYVRSRSFPRRIPLRSYGDGLNRLFGIILSLVNAKNGFLLIDEFENGMHHTVQEKVWGVIFHLASRLNIQVFATSHSWDAIEAFQKAASETPEEGVLVRLSRWGDDIASTLFREDELAIVTRDRIEVR